MGTCFCSCQMANKRMGVGRARAWALALGHQKIDQGGFFEK